MILTMIISLFSSILIGLAPCNSNCAALYQENTVQHVEVKRKDNLVKNYGYLLVSPVEFLSKNEFYEDLNFIRDENTVDTVYSIPYFRDNCKLIAYNHVNTTNSDYGYNSTWAYSIDSVYWQYISGGTTDFTLYKTWDFVITINGGQYVYTNRVRLSYNNSTTDTSLLGVSFVGSTYVGPNNPYWFCVCNSYAWLYNAPGIVNDEYDRGLNQGYNIGYNEGYDSGVERGEEIASDPASDIYETIYNNGYNTGYQVGRSEGIEEASASSGVPALIFTGILNVALLPVDIFLQMFQYEVFGINIAGLISGLLTVCMVIVIIRFLFGGKNGGNNS